MTTEEEEDGARGSRSMAYKAAFLVDCLHFGQLTEACVLIARGLDSVMPHGAARHLAG